MDSRRPKRKKTMEFPEEANDEQNVEAVEVQVSASRCIQRYWRWLLFKRRMALLTGAIRVARSVKSSTLYIEERLLSSLNVISAIDRYMPIPEAHLAIGFAEAPVILDGSPRRRGSIQGAKTKHALGAHALPALPKVLYGRQALPKWFLQEVPLEFVPREVELRSVKGLQGLLLEGLGGPEAFNHFVEDRSFIPVSSPLMEIFSQSAHQAGALQKELQHIGLAETTIAASGGRLRFAELRYPSLRQAKIRAVLLYFCTFNFKRRAFIPLLRRQQLYDVQTAYDILRLWELYGLDWPYRNKVGFFLLRQHDPKASEVVYFNGKAARDFRLEWQSVEEDQKRPGQKRSKEENRKNALQRLAELKKKRRYRDLEEIQEILVSVSVPQLLEALETGRLPGDVDLHSVEAWILGNGANFAHDRASDQKLLAKRAAADKLAMKRRLFEVKEKEANRAQKQKDAQSALGRKKCREWEERLMKFYASAAAERTQTEAEYLKASHTLYGRPTRWLLEEQERVGETEAPEEEEDAEERQEESREGKVQKERVSDVSENLKKGPGNMWTSEEIDETKHEAEEKASKDVHLKTSSSQKAKQSREMRQMAATFCSRRCALQSQIHAADQRAWKAEYQDTVKQKVEEKKKAWKERRNTLEVKQQQLLEHHRRQVDDLRSELQAMMEKRRMKLNQELQCKKAACVEQKVKRITLARDFNAISIDSFSELHMPSWNTTCSASSGFSEARVAIKRGSIDFRQTITTCTGSTATDFTGLDTMQTTTSEGAPQALPEVAGSRRTLHWLCVSAVCFDRFRMER